MTVGTNRHRRVALNMMAATFVPLMLEALFVVAAYAIGPRAPWYSNSGSQLISAAVGFVFVVRAFGIYSIVAGLVYLPAMFHLLIGFALAFNGAVYGNWL